MDRMYLSIARMVTFNNNDVISILIGYKQILSNQQALPEQRLKTVVRGVFQYHVLVAEPTEGYGIFIENMLNYSSLAQQQKAA